VHKPGRCFKEFSSCIQQAEVFAMMSVISGIFLSGAGSTIFWYCLPTKGQTAAIVRKPMIEPVLPIVIVGSLAIGVALIVSGIVS
jgi:hypothetical protein